MPGKRARRKPPGTSADLRAELDELSQTAGQIAYQAGELTSRLVTLSRGLVDPGPGPPFELRQAWSRLPPRQRQVVRMVVQGHSNTAIAAALHLTPNTVRSHLKLAYQTLRLPGRRALVSALKFWVDTAG